MLIGNTVFVNLGYCTVQQGQIVGTRTTTLASSKPSMEYLVQWFGVRDEQGSADWFASGKVFDDAKEAFGIK